jgi:hypothetical protein
MPAGDVIGRGPELGLVSAFLDRPVEGPAGLVLEGEPGIGKSTLWLAAVARARERGLLVLSSRPAEAERGLAHVGLGDLFADVLADVASLISTPRRRALEITSYARRPPTILSIAARLASEFTTWWSCSATRSRSCLRSTTFTGLTRPPRARLRSRCDDSLRRAPIRGPSPQSH